MTKCVNENCNKDPLESPDRVLWGCDADFCCNQECYDAARRQMNQIWGEDGIAHDDRKFASYLGVPVEWIKGTQQHADVAQLGRALHP